MLFKDIKRFETRYRQTNDCWWWMAKRNDAGYGVFYLNNKTVLAHRVSYELYNDCIIKKGYVIDHLCRNRACVKPEHLEEVTLKENTLRGFAPTANNSRKVFCPKGHEYTKENTRYRVYRGNKWRECKICLKDKYIPSARDAWMRII